MANIPAVEVRGAVKSYVTGAPVLNSLDMTVPKGCIYGLLGSSGSGKTTCLSCIVGLRQLDSGSIHVFGRPVPGFGIPGKRLGYMPQDIALYPHFTIREILLYFGRIYGMAKSDILKREEFLSSFLQLPNSSKRISSLSGGQQRRISLAVALTANPELIVLDEPTVGLDPMLRNSIWDHLCQLVTNGRTTVIITTHYTEEVRRSHMIGLMRYGRLLTEDSPENLLQTFNSSLLEDIVLELCRQDHRQNNKRWRNNSVVNVDEGESSSDEENERNTKNIYRRQTPRISVGSVTGLPLVTNSKKFPKTKDNGFVAESQNRDCLAISFNDLKGDNQLFESGSREIPATSVTTRQPKKIDNLASFTSGTPVQRILSLIRRNFIFFSRNLGFFFILLIYPGLQTALVASTIGGDPKNMSLAVFNMELPDWRDHCTSIGQAEPSCDAKPYSCTFLNKLDNGHVKLVPFPTKQQALEETQLGKHYGILTIPSNYTQHLVDRAVLGNFAGNDTLDGTTIRYELDYSNYVASLLITRQLYSSLETYAMELGGNCGKSPQEFEIPLKYKPVYGRLDSKYTEYVVPGALVIILFLIPLSTCGLAFVADKRQGTMDRSRAAGVTTFEMMIAFFVTDGLAIIIQTVISTTIIVYGFEFSIEGSYVLYGLLCFLTGLCGQSWGFVLGILCPDEWTLLLTGFSLHFPLLIQGGIIWPLDGLPLVVKYFSHCLPVTASLHSLRSIISRGVGMENIHVWPGFVILSIWVIAAWCLAIVKYKSFRK